MRSFLLVCVLVFAGWRTHQQMQTWRSDPAVWTQAVTVNPTSARASINLAAAYIQVGEYGAAAQEDKTALRLAIGMFDETLIQHFVGLHLRWMSPQTAVCSRPGWQPLCSLP